jgi:hypothetical protein
MPQTATFHPMAYQKKNARNAIFGQNRKCKKWKKNEKKCI